MSRKSIVVMFLKGFKYTLSMDSFSMDTIQALLEAIVISRVRKRVGFFLFVLFFLVFFFFALAHLVSFLLENYCVLINNPFEVLGDTMKATGYFIITVCCCLTITLLLPPPPPGQQALKQILVFLLQFALVY